MKLLIAGAGTPAGRELIALFKHMDIFYQVIPDRLLNTSDHESLGQLFSRHNPDQLINLHTFKANSQAAVLKAEVAEEECRNIHQQYTVLLADFCEQNDLPLMHLSTCYVFDGEKKLGYNEQDEVDPAGVYGKSAIIGEQAIAKVPKHIILRTGWLFGQSQCDVIKSWIKACKKSSGLLSVSRRRFSPTSNADLARIVLGICQQIDSDANVWGTYHYCGLETKKESEFVKQVLNYASQYDEEIYQLLDSIKISEVHAHPPEVSNTTLSSKKIFDTFGIKQRSWHGDLKNTIKSVCQGTTGADEVTPSVQGVQLPDNLNSKRLH